MRFTQLASSANRLAGLNFSFDERYVVVNIPSTQVEAVENGRVVHHYIAIVGDPDHPSPEISAHIQVVNLNPTWTVPTSIIKKEIIPRMQRDPGYLTRAKIRILDGQGKEINPKSINWSTERAVNYTLRQDSGAHNSLGSIRIGMPNKLAVYMHDTPGKGAFGADYRFLSHGCVRVQGVYDYAAWLLEGTGGAWDKTALEAKIKEGARYDVPLNKAVPVIWVYLTGWSNAERNRKMAVSAHAYVRGSTTRVLRMLEASGRPDLPEGPPVWICGDCHVGNLGPVASTDGKLAIQVRDLDQTVIGNPAHDLIRLGLSLAMAARGSDLPGITTAQMVERMVFGYAAAFEPEAQGEVTDSHSAMPATVKLVMKQAAKRS